MALLLTSKGFQTNLHVKEAFPARKFGVLDVQHLVWSTDSESDPEQIGQHLQAYDPATYTHTDAATGLTFLDPCGPRREAHHPHAPQPARTAPHSDRRPAPQLTRDRSPHP